MKIQKTKREKGRKGEKGKGGIEREKKSVATHKSYDKSMKAIAHN